MSRGDRRTGVVFGLLTAVAWVFVVWLALIVLAPRSDRVPHLISGTLSRVAHSESADLSTAATLEQSGRASLECGQRCQESDQIGRADLVAQQRMAVSAEQIVTLTILQLMLSILTAIGLVVTILYAAANVKEMRRQTNGNTETAQKQLRAYVHIQNIAVDPIELDNSKPIVATLSVKNYGQTPAFRCAVRFEFRVREFPNDGEFADPNPSSVSRDTLPAGGVLARRISANISKDLLERIVAGTSAFYFSGRIDFEDVFGRQQWSKFRYMFGGDVGAPEEFAWVCTDGNESS